MTQQEKRPYDDMAEELLRFLGVKKDEALYAYLLQRAQTFLEMKFGHVELLQKEVADLRQWKTDMMPVAVGWSETHNPSRLQPFPPFEEE